MIGEFSGRVSKEEKCAWTCVVWPDSVKVPGGGRAIQPALNSYFVR